MCIHVYNRGEVWPDHWGDGRNPIWCKRLSPTQEKGGVRGNPKVEVAAKKEPALPQRRKGPLRGAGKC